jgi:hypothetical protein
VDAQRELLLSDRDDSLGGRRAALLSLGRSYAYGARGKKDAECG